MGEKKQIRISVKDKIACLVDKEQFLVCGNNDYEVVFDFDSDWEGINAKTAIFVYGNTPIHQPFVGNVCEGIEIKNATLCAIGVFAGDIKTTTGATVECRTSIRDLGGVPKPPTKEVYDEIMALLDKAIEAHTELPVGGKTGQVLKKRSDADYDTAWENDEQRDLTKIENDIKKLDTSVTDLKGSVQALGTDLDTSKADIAALEEKEEWDFVITKLEDFTTEKLSTMSGRVLVKGVVYDGTIDWNNPGEYIEALSVKIPSSIKLIKLIDSTLYAVVTATLGVTKIEGFVGGGESGYYYSELIGFGSVQNCGGYLILRNCRNIENTTIQYAYNCYNLRGIIVDGDSIDGIDYGFRDCTLITGVDFSVRQGGASVVEFNNCKHVSNVYNNNPDYLEIDYINCDWVNGDTCDGYYTAEDNGKVQTVNTSGEKSLISVYDKTEIDGMIGDISTALDELHAYAQSLVNGGATV